MNAMKKENYLLYQRFHFISLLFSPRPRLLLPLRLGVFFVFASSLVAFRLFFRSFLSCCAIIFSRILARIRLVMEFNKDTFFDRFIRARTRL